MMHVLPTLLDRYCTLGAVSQQSMEGNQNFTQHDLRHAGYGPRGRPKKADLELGAERWAEVLAERRKKADSPEKWMWEAAVWRFITEQDHAFLLALVDKLKEDGDVLQQSELTMLWKRYSATAHCGIQWASQARLRWARKDQSGPAELYAGGYRSRFYAQLQLEQNKYYADQTDFSHQRPQDAADSLVLERKTRFAQLPVSARVCASWPSLHVPRADMSVWPALQSRVSPN